MPELDPLPGRPRVPDFSPRTGDFAAVVSRAKNRRRRHVAGAGAGMAGVAVAVALSMGGGGSLYGLQPAPPVASVGDERPTASPEESPSPEPSGPEEPVTPAPGATAAPGGGGPGAEDPEPEPEPTAEPPATGPAGGGGQQPPPRAQRPRVTRDVVDFVTAYCTTDGTHVPETGWCIAYEGPAQVQIGVPATFRSLACRAPGRGANTMYFETEQEVEFTVFGDSSRAEWTWSGGYRWADEPTSVRVEDGTCARWSVTWDGVGSDGDPLRPGSYYMQADIYGSLSNIGATTVGNGGEVEVVE